MANTAKAKKKPRTASIDRVLNEINALIRAIDASGATEVKKARAKALLFALKGLIRGFCLAATPQCTYTQMQFEGKKRGK